MLASIHGGIPGTSIPREVMDFYKAMKGGDAFRPKILKEIVLTLETQVAHGITDQQSFEAAVRDRLEIVAARLPKCRLENWLIVNPERERFISCTRYGWSDRLRAGYVAEGMEMFDDTMSYAVALAG